MEIKCPRCGEALELPDEAVGNRVQCPLCEKSFVAPTISMEEWVGTITARFQRILSSLQPHDKDIIDKNIIALAEKRESDSRFRSLEVVEMLASPLGLLIIIDCQTTSDAALAFVARTELRGYRTVVRDIQGVHGVGVFFRFEMRLGFWQDSKIDLKKAMEGAEWGRCVADDLALPAFLGVDFLNTDCVIDLAKLNCLYCTGGDCETSDRLARLLERGITSCRTPEELLLLSLCFDGVQYEADDKYLLFKTRSLDSWTNKNWIQDSLDYIERIINELERRSKLFDSAGCYSYADYRRNHVIPQIVIFIYIAGEEVNRKAGEIIDALGRLIEQGFQKMELKDYGMHIVLFDYGPNDQAAFPFYVHDSDGIGFICRGTRNEYVPSLPVVGKSHFMQLGDLSTAVYKSPEDEMRYFLQPNDE